MLVNVPGKSMPVKLEQFRNAPSPMDSISLTAVTDVREVHPSNMCEGIFVTEAGNDTLVRDAQPSSTPVMLSAKTTSFGNSMLVRAVAPSKAPDPEIVLRVEGRSISERLLQPLTIMLALISSTPSSK